MPARGFFCFFANPHPGGPGSPVDRHKDRSARSVLNRGSVLKAKRAKPPLANAAGNPVLGLSHRVEPVASAASVSAERLAHCIRRSAQPRLARTLVGQCAFRRSASLFSARDLVRKPQLHFRDHALSRKRIFRGLVVSKARMQSHREIDLRCALTFPSPLAGEGGDVARESAAEPGEGSSSSALRADPPP